MRNLNYLKVTRACVAQLRGILVDIFKRFDKIAELDDQGKAWCSAHRTELTVLQESSMTGEVSKLDQLLANPDRLLLNLDIKFPSFSPLSRAVSLGYVAVAERLIRGGADCNKYYAVNAQDTVGLKLIFYASLSSRNIEEIMTLILNHYDAI